MINLMWLLPWVAVGLIQFVAWTNYLAHNYKKYPSGRTIAIAVISGLFFSFYMIYTILNRKRSNKKAEFNERTSAKNLFSNINEFKNFDIKDHNYKDKEL